MKFSGSYFKYDSYSVPIYRFLYCTLSSIVPRYLAHLATWLAYCTEGLAYLATWLAYCTEGLAYLATWIASVSWPTSVTWRA